MTPPIGDLPLRGFAPLSPASGGIRRTRRVHNNLQAPYSTLLIHANAGDPRVFLLRGLNIRSTFVPMPTTAIPCEAPDHEMIEAMTRCAFELGSMAGEIAKRAGDDTARFLAASAEFRHCFFAVRMGIRLKLAVRAAARLAPPGLPMERPEMEWPERERSDAVERPERDDTRLENEREREGDYEPVSLPAFLKTLRGVAARAEIARDELPAHVRDTTLPLLANLLRQAGAPPEGDPRSGGAASAVAVLARPPTARAARSRLLTSTVTPAGPPRPSPGCRPSG